jgi:putative transposase
MARRLRLEGAGLTYHVWARGLARMVIYRDDSDREEFLERFAAITESHNVDCHAYCLMCTHYHLVITTNEANLSGAMKQLNSPYAKWWNGRHSRTGHLLHDRFGSQLIEEDSYLLTACRYVVLNPVRAGMVSRPEEWPWSSYRATAGLDPIPAFLRPDMLWRQLGGKDPNDAALRYTQFVRQNDAGVLNLPRDAVLGNESFVQRFEELRKRASREVPKRDRESPPALASFFADPFNRAARALGACEARRAGYSLLEIGDFLGVHYTTVVKMIARAKALGQDHERHMAN